MKKLLGGNWKMNCNLATFGFIDNLHEADFNNVEAFIAVPAIYISEASKKFPSFIKIAAQDMSIYEKGKYTGEISIDMLKEYGVEYTIIGHSERRQFFNEGLEDIYKKIKLAQQKNLKPVLCIGETRESRESNNHLEVLHNDLLRSLRSIRNIDMDIAYEPLYAIGNGEPAKLENIAETAKMIKKWKKELGIYGRTIYGGSVDESLIDAINGVDDLDGVFIGKDSLNESFGRIAKKLGTKK